jgi:hypothetical protein
LATAAAAHLAVAKEAWGRTQVFFLLSQMAAVEPEGTRGLARLAVLVEALVLLLSASAAVVQRNPAALLVDLAGQAQAIT